MDFSVDEVEQLILQLFEFAQTHSDKHGEVPIAAMIVKHKRLNTPSIELQSADRLHNNNNDRIHIISCKANEVMIRNDVTAHAEILAIQEAQRVLNTRYLNECTIFTTLEPCPMCAHAISLAKISNIYFGAEDKKGGAIANNCLLYQNMIFGKKPKVYHGFCSQQISEKMRGFFQALRIKKTKNVI